MMNTVNQKIIDAVIAKAEKVCPDSLALIGVYGSVATGDFYEKSDLDLLILIQDDKGWQLGTGFILDDSKIGYDIYCTNWEGLRYDAECHHAQISKLMDSKIVYVKNEEAYVELCKLREQAKQFLESEERFERVSELLDKAKISYANACLHEELGQVRLDAYGVIYYLLDALMIYHGSYFKRGVKRTFEELDKLSHGEVFANLMKKVAESKEISELRELLKGLFLCAEKHMKQEKQKEAPSEGMSGTYEEMYSNWRNKVEEAANSNNVFASYMNMCSLHYMLSDITSEVEIGIYNIMGEYNPDCLEENVRIYDKYLQKYEEVYQQAGISIKRFSDVDEFVADYLGG
ncbi:MAG: nucleotidyltransferase domain-containing protein [Lachnospiraceae bacterium]|nr:nucleotidyltransferase domain-containing protein [Lachnospiraceae bacterium]